MADGGDAAAAETVRETHELLVSDADAAARDEAGRVRAG
jgi:hypothetical protein